MTAHSEVRPIRIAPAQAPGHLDLQTLQSWAAGLASEAGPEMTQRMGMGSSRVRCTASVLSAPEQWQQSPDAARLDVHWGQVCGCVAVPMALVMSVVNRCLGYGGNSELPLQRPDWAVLIAWLRPAITCLQDRAGLPDPAGLQPGQACLQRPGEGPLILFSFSITMGAAAGTWQLVLPWEPLREAVRSVTALGGKRTCIPMSCLGGVPVNAEVTIRAGSLPLAEGLQLGTGDVITLDHDLRGSVELSVGGRRVGEGRLGSRGGKWALRITTMQWATTGPGAQEAQHD